MNLRKKTSEKTEIGEPKVLLERVRAHLRMIQALEKDVLRAMKRIERRISAQREKAITALNGWEKSLSESPKPFRKGLKTGLNRIVKQQEKLSMTSYKNADEFLQRYQKYLKLLIGLQNVGKSR